MKTFQEFLYENRCATFTHAQIKDLERFADSLLDKHDIDIQFTKHFGERMGDSRNNPCIKIAEIQQLMKKIDDDKGKRLKAAGKDGEAVLVDLQKKLNLPFVIDIDKNGEFEVRFKTVMRKERFHTPDRKVVMR